MEALHRKYPDAPLLAVGFSAGGHVLLRHLARVGDGSPLLATALVSHCGDLIKEYKRAERTPGRPYIVALRHECKVNTRYKMFTTSTVLVRTLYYSSDLD